MSIGLELKPIVGVREAETFTANPFMSDLTVITRPKRLTVSRNSSIIDQSTGEVEGFTEIAQVVLVDEAQFVKVFTKDLAVWFDLSKSALRVFGFIMTTTQKYIGSDLIYLDFKTDEAKQFITSSRSVYAGLAELIDKQFIAKHQSAGWYYINPSMIFNGNRARFVKEYRKSSIKELERLGQQTLELD
jgi:hypothetical protein